MNQQQSLKTDSHGFLGKYGIMAGVGILQSLIAVWIIISWVGVEVTNIPLFIVAAIVTSLTYMALIQFFCCYS